MIRKKGVKIHLFVQTNFPVQVFRCKTTEILIPLCVIGFEFCHRGVQYSLATRGNIGILSLPRILETTTNMTINTRVLLTRLKDTYINFRGMVLIVRESRAMDLYYRLQEHEFNYWPLDLVTVYQLPHRALLDELHPS